MKFRDTLVIAGSILLAGCIIAWSLSPRPAPVADKPAVTPPTAATPPTTVASPAPDPVPTPKPPVAPVAPPSPQTAVNPLDALDAPTPTPAVNPLAKAILGWWTGPAGKRVEFRPGGVVAQRLGGTSPGPDGAVLSYEEEKLGTYRWIDAAHVEIQLPPPGPDKPAPPATRLTVTVVDGQLVTTGEGVSTIYTASKSHSTVAPAGVPAGLLGEWKMVSTTSASDVGERPPGKRPADLSPWVFDGDGAEVRISGGRIVRVTYRYVANGNDAAALDVAMDVGSGKTMPLPMLAKLDGNSLQLALSENGKGPPARPGSFEPAAGTRVMKFERVKPTP